MLFRRLLGELSPSVSSFPKSAVKQHYAVNVQYSVSLLIMYGVDSRQTSVCVCVCVCVCVFLFARDSIYAKRAYAIAIPSVCLSVRPSHGWISQKRLKLGSRNFHPTVAQSL